MNKRFVVKVTLYEAIANLASSTILGFVIGLIASAMAVALFF
jgi:hypothetical protein